MKIIKKLSSISIISILVFLFFILISNNSVQANDDTYPYEIYNHTMVIDVKDTNKLYIKETIDIKYNIYNSEVSKRINKTFKVNHNDKTYTRWALITDIDYINGINKISESDDYIEYVLDVSNKWINKFEGLSSIQKDSFIYFFFGSYDIN